MHVLRRWKRERRILFVVLVASGATCCYTPSFRRPIPIHVEALNFEPLPVGSTNFDINWAGPPRDRLKFSDVSRYWPTIRLQNNIPRLPTSPQWILRSFWIKEDRQGPLGIPWPDTTLGFFGARFVALTNEAAELEHPNAIGNAQPPRNSPPGGSKTFFWLGCTELGKVRGNEGQGDDGHALMLDRISGANLLDQLLK